MLRQIDHDAEVFYKIGRLQCLLDCISDVVHDQPFEREGESDEGMHRLDALTMIASDMLKSISSEFEMMFKQSPISEG